MSVYLKPWDNNGKVTFEKETENYSFVSSYVSIDFFENLEIIYSTKLWTSKGNNSSPNPKILRRKTNPVNHFFSDRSLTFRQLKTNIQNIQLYKREKMYRFKTIKKVRFGKKDM